jgi:hypothetical protein
MKNLLWLIPLALALRLIHLVERPMISKDGVSYVQAVDRPDLSGVTESWGQPVYLFAAWMLRGLGAQAACHIVALAFGIATLIPLYWLAARIGGPSLANLAGLLYAVHPLTVVMDSDVSNCSTATFFTLLSFIAIWRAIFDRSLAACFVAPMLCFLAIMSRREALALMPFAFLFAAGCLALSVRRDSRHLLEPTLRLVFVGGSCFPLLALLALSIPLAQEKLYLLTQTLAGVPSLSPSDMEGLADFFFDGAQAVYLSILPFALIGVLARPFPRAPYWSMFAFLAVSLGMTLYWALHGSRYASSRYFLINIPLILVFAAVGLTVFQRRLAIFSIALAIAVLPCVGRIVFSPYRSEAPYREAADHIRATYGEGRVISATRSQIAYYARGKHIQYPDLTAAEFVVLRSAQAEILIREQKAELIQSFGGDVRLMRPRK